MWATVYEIASSLCSSQRQRGGTVGSNFYFINLYSFLISSPSPYPSPSEGRGKMLNILSRGKKFLNILRGEREFFKYPSRGEGKFVGHPVCRSAGQIQEIKYKETPIRGSDLELSFWFILYYFIFQ